jgi:hypothetical protein
MFNNNKPFPAGATAPAPQHLLPAPAGMREMRARAFAAISLLHAAAPAGAHAYRDSQVIFFGHDLPQDYNRRR